MVFVLLDTNFLDQGVPWLARYADSILPYILNGELHLIIPAVCIREHRRHCQRKHRPDLHEELLRQIGRLHIEVREHRVSDETIENHAAEARLPAKKADRDSSVGIRDVKIWYTLVESQRDYECDIFFATCNYKDFGVAKDSCEIAKELSDEIQEIGVGRVTLIPCKEVFVSQIEEAIRRYRILQNNHVSNPTALARQSFASRNDVEGRVYRQLMDYPVERYWHINCHGQSIQFDFKGNYMWHRRLWISRACAPNDQNYIQIDYRGTLLFQGRGWPVKFWNVGSSPWMLPADDQVSGPAQLVQVLVDIVAHEYSTYIEYDGNMTKIDEPMIIDRKIRENGVRILPALPILAHDITLWMKMCGTPVIR